ncbi:MAG TPA: M14 family metallopeptidase [Stenotrophomonas sp.]|jgi:hypothetical protein
MFRSIRLTRLLGRAFVFVLAVAALPALAQSSYYFPSATPEFDPAVPTPEQFLGYPIGSRYTRHDRLVDYFRELARVSDKVSLKEIGRSYEDRPLISVIVTSAQNQSRLEALRAAHARLADPRDTHVDPAQVPVVVGLYYSVHGNETSSGEAAMLTAYYLVAHRGADTARWLQEAIVLIDPAQNPDGRDRAANWHNAWRSTPPVSDPLDKEHVEPFPGGRGNHYFTDLNRDWLAITQQETRAKLALFHQWYPNVQIDFHEMGAGSTYYFEPSPQSMQSPLLPKASYDWNVTLAKYHAQGLDALGSLYYSGENFDNFSPVYGSTYPDFHGGVGATLEQASSRGLVQDTANGPLEFRFTIRNHVATGLATVRGSVAEHAGLLALQQDFFRSALKQGQQYPVAAFVFGDRQDPTTSRALLDLLLQQHIQVQPLSESVELQGQRYESGSAWVVASAQPQFRLVHSIFESTPPVKGSVYGSTSYAIAPAYGLSVGRAKRVPAGGGILAALPASAASGVVGGAAGYAYVIDWRDAAAPRLLYRLLELGLRVRVAGREFTVDTSAGERSFGYGSLVVPVTAQPLAGESLRAAIDAAAREAGITVVGLVSGHSRSGIDLGSDGFKPVRKPKVALVMGQGVNSAEIGSAWFLLDQQLHWPATRLDPAQLATVPLEDYTSLVLSGGQYADLTPRAVEKLRRWIEAGGSLVAYGSGAKWAADQQLAPFVPKPEAGAKPEDDKEAADDKRRDFADRQDVLSEQRLSGNLVSADADISHPLAWGLQRRDIHVNRESNLRLPKPADAFSSVVRVSAKPQINGYLSEQNRGKFADALWAGVYAGGKGNVVLFADDPAHRKYWHGTERLLINALLFGDLLTPPPPRG